jgi:hypothetical protein
MISYILITGRTQPSFIRTLPSAPEFHRIMRLTMPGARGLYRRSGIWQAIAACSAPCPEGDYSVGLMIDIITSS